MSEERIVTEFTVSFRYDERSNLYSAKSSKYPMIGAIGRTITETLECFALSLEAYFKRENKQENTPK